MEQDSSAKREQRRTAAEDEPPGELESMEYGEIDIPVPGSTLDVNAPPVGAPESEHDAREE